MRILVRLLIVSFVAAATSLQAITYIVPTDRDLVKRAEAIVIATAVESHAEIRDGGRIVTVATLRVERLLKGSAGDSVQLVELGGAVGNRMTFVPGAPRYEDGKRYLVFLHTNNAGEWMTFGFGLGKFEFVSDLRGRELLARGEPEEKIFGLNESDGSLHVEKLRGRPEFLSFIEIRIDSEAPALETYFVNPSDVVLATFPEFRPHAQRFIPIAQSTRPSYLLSGNYRWQNGPTAAFLHCCNAQTGGTGLDGPSAFSAAMSAWNGVSGAGIHYTLTGPEPNQSQVPGGLMDNGSDGKNDIIFNDRHGLIGGGGAVAIGGISNVSGSYSNLGDSVTYFATSEVDVETGSNLPSFINQSLYTQLLTHELGHTLGFRHADGSANPLSPQNNDGGCQAPNPCAVIGQAIMASAIPTPNNIGSLSQWELDAAQTVYGSGPVCTPPSIGTQPANVSINAGQSTTLSVGATGTGLTYQWYIGSSGTTTALAPNGTGTQLTVSPSTTTNYWVRVSGQCAPPADSRTAIVTVTCVSPSVPAPLASPSSIASGQSSTLAASPTGSGPFSYQWYVGNSGDTSNLITAATNSSTTVSPNVTTNYWVKVTGQCGTFNSPAATVTVSCNPIPLGGVTAQPSTINVGQSSIISVATSGSGPFTFQWFRGSLGDASNPIQGATGSSTVVSPVTNTSYWVHVTAPCGSQDGTVTVFVNAPCTPSSITTHPTFATIAPGASATLTVVAAGTAPISYQWYTGTSGNTNSPIANATNASVTVSPTVTTSYWVHVSNSCNATGNNSVTALVTVSVNCPAPTITTQPASVSAPIGTAPTLTVVATAPGTTIHYQWYKGAKGDLSTKVGTDSPTFTTDTVAVTASYWVRMTPACNNLSFTDSNAAIVTAVATLKGRAVRH
jgi:hypothetical protein